MPYLGSTFVRPSPDPAVENLTVRAGPVRHFEPDIDPELAPLPPYKSHFRRPAPPFGTASRPWSSPGMSRATSVVGLVRSEQRDRTGGHPTPRRHIAVEQPTANPAHQVPKSTSRQSIQLDCYKAGNTQTDRHHTIPKLPKSSPGQFPFKGYPTSNGSFPSTRSTFTELLMA